MNRELYAQVYRCWDVFDEVRSGALTAAVGDHAAFATDVGRIDDLRTE